MIFSHCNDTANKEPKRKNVAKCPFFVVKSVLDHKTTKTPADWQEFKKSLFSYSSIMMVQLNTPSDAEKRQEPLYFSAVEITLWMPMPCKYSGISSNFRDWLQVFSHEITK